MVNSEDWKKAQGEICTRCHKEVFQLFDHPTGRVCKACREWLDDNYIEEAPHHLDGAELLLLAKDLITGHGRVKQLKQGIIGHMEQRPKVPTAQELRDFAAAGGFFIHPRVPLERHIELVVKKGGCPCDPERPECPCPEAKEEVQATGNCVCTFFVSAEYLRRWGYSMDRPEGVVT